MARWATAWLFGPAALWGVVAAGGVAVTLADPGAWSAPDRSRARFVGSEQCRSCHRTQHETWHASWHRTMTQDVRGGAPVLAPFAGETLDVLGFRATMDRTGAGTPRVAIAKLGEDGESDVPLVTAEVELAIGSHRYQQYAVRLGAGELCELGERRDCVDESALWRLPVAWHVGLSRWIHLGGAFLTPDGAAGEEGDYFRHLARWNDNCAFCHNTDPAPGRRDDGSFATTVAEHGIACESCHGPASLHVDRHQALARRLLARFDEGDGSVAHPGRLGSALGSDVCGRCHGQRIGRDIARVLDEGDGFLPGTPLSSVSRPIFRDSSLAGEDAAALPFAARFWPDGTPRLSAYEYQGLLLSACHQDGRGLGCGDCHTMHGDEPDMQLVPGWDGKSVCVRCHDEGALSGARESGGHGGHGLVVACVGCHMPRTTYGLVEGMISHRIGSPDPAALLGRHDQPDACTQCHVDRSRAWAVVSLPGLGLPEHAPVRGEDERERWASRVALDLVGGDPIQRSLAAHALARAEAVGAWSDRAAALALALHDDYPAVRLFAARGLGELAARHGDAALREAIAAFDFLGDPAARETAAVAVLAHVGPHALAREPARLEALEQSREARAIWIGE